MRYKILNGPYKDGILDDFDLCIEYLNKPMERFFFISRDICSIILWNFICAPQEKTK